MNEVVKENNPVEKEESEQFEWMMAESKKLSSLIGVADTAVIDIYKCATDWEFILKIDALLEAAVKKVIKTNLTGSERMDKAKLEGFVDTLPIQGRASLITLLKAAGCGDDEVKLIECVRRLRNGFAHDIVQINSSLIDVIKRRNDKSALIQGLCYIANYEEAELIKMYEKDGKNLRFSIVHGTLIFLILAYHGAVTEVGGRDPFLSWQDVALFS